MGGSGVEPVPTARDGVFVSGAAPVLMSSPARGSHDASGAALLRRSCAYFHDNYPQCRAALLSIHVLELSEAAPGITWGGGGRGLTPQRRIQVLETETIKNPKD